MDAFERELMRRSPLAASVLEISDYLFDEPWLESVYQKHRGRCYQDKLSFGRFVRLMRDALIRHGGSAHQLFLELEADDEHPVDESNFYRKLSHTPVELSRALLRESAGRLSLLMPSKLPANLSQLPACFEGYELIAADGKRIKNVCARLKLTRGYSGALLGAKALVALNLRSGLAVAMSDSLDGLTNDVPLVGDLLRQVREVIPRPVLSVWDRQFDDAATFRRLAERPGDSFVVRARKGDAIFTVESSVESVDEQGRRVIDEIGVLSRSKNKSYKDGKAKQPLRLRRVTLVRSAGRQEPQPAKKKGPKLGKRNRQHEKELEDVILMTDLLDREKFSALDLLGLYLRRWHIETVFQQVTETFSLEHLIGCRPQAVLFQFAFCLLLYNLVQVIKAYIAADGQVLASVISTFHLFQSMRKQLVAWAHYSDGEPDSAEPPRGGRDAAAMRLRLGELLKGAWNRSYTKAPDKRPRGRPQAKQRLHGDHTSVQRLLERTAKDFAK